MSFSVSSFTSQLTYDGARPNLFQVTMALPANVVSGGTNPGQEISVMAKAASIPTSKMGIIVIPYMGRQVKVPGNVTYDDWTITIINDEDFPIRNAFESWHNLINSHVGNVRDTSMVQMSGYAINASVMQYAKSGPTVIKQYDFVGMWPNNVSAIQLGWDQNDQVEQFDVTFSCQYWNSTIPTVVTT